MHVEDYLGYGNLQGQYGFDTVEAGFQGSGGPTLQHTVVTWYEDEDFLVGMFGLSARPTSFTLTAAANDTQLVEPSYLSMLYNQSKITSYTAGAKYMFNEVFGSLTLGGYDKGLFVPNNVEFSFGPDQSYDLQVGLQSITASNARIKDLLPEPDDYFIDSTTSHIWLPLEACRAFEQAFGLVYDNATELYLLNTMQHAALLTQNSSVTFLISPLINGDSFHQIPVTLPYAAFDLEVSWGYTNISAPTPYFPPAAQPTKPDTSSGEPSSKKHT